MAKKICGKNLFCEFDVDGTLIIGGTGEMYDFDKEKPPWQPEQILRVVVKDGASTIGKYAFNQCVRLKYVEIPSSVKEIRAGAFGGCKNLKDVNISAGVAEIENEAFYACTALETIMLPDSVRYVGKDVFGGCISLKTICCRECCLCCRKTLAEGNTAEIIDYMS